MEKSWDQMHSIHRHLLHLLSLQGKTRMCSTTAQKMWSSWSRLSWGLWCWSRDWSLSLMRKGCRAGSLQPWQEVTERAPHQCLSASEDGMPRGWTKLYLVPSNRTGRIERGWEIPPEHEEELCRWAHTRTGCPEKCGVSITEDT